MKQSNNNRFVNILISIVGLVCCIGACFIPASEGLLGDESITMMQLYQEQRMILFIALPAALAVLSCIIVMIGRASLAAVLSALAGCCLYAASDVSLAMNHQAFPGVLISAVGIVLIMTGACLQAFATDRFFSEEKEDQSYDAERDASLYSDIYLTDIKSTEVSAPTEMTDILKQAETVKTEAVVDNNRKTVSLQPATDQSDVITDFYAGIEDLFTDNTQNGGRENE